MGVIFTALIQYPEVLDFRKLVDDLKDVKMFPKTNKINEERNNLNAKMSTYVDTDMEEYLKLDFGKVDLIFNRSKVSCIRIGCSWGYFLSDDKTRLLVRRICEEFARYFKQDRIIYLPDHYGIDYVYRENNIEQIIISLKKRLGDQPENIESIYKEFEEYVEDDGYYIDTLESLIEDDHDSI